MNIYIVMFDKRIEIYNFTAESLQSLTIKGQHLAISDNSLVCKLAKLTTCNVLCTLWPVSSCWAPP